jgi:microcystin degradation protein MlrC
VDFRSTGERAARLLLRILDDGVRPVTARVTIPALVRGEELITETGVFGRLTRRAAALETGGAALAAGILISNPFTDVPELQTSVFVTTDADPDRAAAEALALAADFWAVHETMVKGHLLDEAVGPRRQRGGTIMLTDGRRDEFSLR